MSRLEEAQLTVERIEIYFIRIRLDQSMHKGDVKVYSSVCFKKNAPSFGCSTVRKHTTTHVRTGLWSWS